MGSYIVTAIPTTTIEINLLLKRSKM